MANIDLLQKTFDLCDQYNIKPARSKGQNFLITKDYYDKIVAVADLKADDIVLEVGPGLGFLTEKLATKVKKVITVELDDKLAGILRADFVARGIHNVEVVNENILDFKIENPPAPFIKGAFKIVANLPYNISSIFLRKFLSGENKPEMMVLMLQKEVAERIAARPPHMSILAVSVQYYAKAEIIEYVTKDNFWPAPEVDSAIIQLKVKESKPTPTLPFRQREGERTYPRIDFSSPLPKGRLGGVTDVDKDRDFFRLVKIGFSAKRKMLKNNLAGGLHIEQILIEDKLKLAGFNLKIRAQELSVDDWVRLVEAMSEFVV